MNGSLVWSSKRPFASLDESDRATIEAALQTIGKQLFTSRDAFEKALPKALKATGLKIGAPIKKAILAALSERHEEADICADKNGKPEADTDLRDHELVPLAEDWPGILEA